jgi:hypothetical protein
MKDMPDYSKYTLDQLYDVHYHIDRDKYPDRFQIILHEIAKRKTEKSDQEQIYTISKPKESLPVYPANPIQLDAIILDAISNLWSNKLNFFRILIIPVLLVFALEYYRIHILDANKFGLRFLISFIEFFIGCIYAISCHRLILLGDDSVPSLGLRIPQKREFNFIGWTILTGLIVAPIWILAAFFIFKFDFIHIQLKFYLAIIPAQIILARLIIILPAVALDHRPSIKWAWKQTSGNGWKLFLLTMIPSLILLPVNIFSINDGSLIFSMQLKIINLMVVLIGILFASLAFKELFLKQQKES